MKVVVIGAGASGLVSAIYAAKSGFDVTLIERNEKLGKKLLITGNGKCNYFNSDMNLEHYYSSNKEVLKNIINEENQNQMLEFFESIGISPMIKDGYYYPISNKAISVRDALVLECSLLGVEIINNFLVTDIKKENKFIIYSDDKTVTADKVIMAVGSKAYPKTGSDGTGYNILRNFNHSIVKPLPSLVPLVGKGNYFNKWEGARAKCTLTLNNIKEDGEVQFTSYGISGICVFNLSSHISKLLDDNKSQTVFINFVPWLQAKNTNEVLDYLNQRGLVVTGRSVFQLLEGLLDYKLINIILEKSNIDKDKYFDELNKKEKFRLSQNLFSFDLEIIKTKSFDNAQTCIGGVIISEVNPRTMESKLVKDLYITGELLDVNGDCGGYNLAFAFITGMIAGRMINSD